jgi:glutamate racemase
VLGQDVTLVSSAEETAKDVYRTLSKNNLLREENNSPKHRFVATGSSDGFSALGNRILGTPVVPEIHKFN